MAPAWRLDATGGKTWLAGPGGRYPLPYGTELLRELARFRPGDELFDELLRSEHPPYILDRLRALTRGRDAGSWQVLDFGCGAGASAVCLARLGVRRVVGVDLRNEYAGIWRRRLAEAGFPDVGRFVQAGEPVALPFRDGAFDAVFLNGVLEHLLPEERAPVLRETWRVLRRGGFYFLTETPNRWFPRNSHTKLWGSEWLPLRGAARLAARLGPRRDFPTTDRTAMYRTGMRGASAGQVGRALGFGAERIRLPADIVEMEFCRARNPLQHPTGDPSGGRAAWRVARFLGSLPGLTPHDFSPHLNLCFRKR